MRTAALAACLSLAAALLSGRPAAPVRPAPPSPHPSLLRLAHRVASAAGWEPYFHDHLWLSDEQILCARRRGGTNPDDVELLRLNVRTGRTQSLTKLARLTHGLSARHARVALSPDRKWLLRVDLDSAGAIAVTVDGAQAVRWSATARGFANSQVSHRIAWFPDSRRWADFALAADHVVTGLTVWDRLQPKLRRALPAPPMRLIAETDPLLLPGERYLVSSWLPDDETDLTVDLYVGSLNSHAKAAICHPVAVPPDSNIREMVCSPDGAQVAWLLASGAACSCSNIPVAGPQPDAVFGIWTCRTDGSGMHEIGSIVTPAGKALDPLPRSLHWLPGSTRLSFLYQDSLWILPLR